MKTLIALIIFVVWYGCERPKQARTPEEQAEDIRRAYDPEATDRELLEE